MKVPEPIGLKLTDDISTPTSINSLVDELETIEEFFMKMKVKSSLNKVNIPNSSPVLEALAKENELNLMNSTDRQKLTLFLQTVRTKAPLIHLSFGSPPDNKFLSALIHWFRNEINPLILISVGLQPNIGAGFKMRTTNKYFDFGLSKHLFASKKVLVDLLSETIKK
jgi:hypothetical protein